MTRIGGEDFHKGQGGSSDTPSRDALRDALFMLRRSLVLMLGLGLLFATTAFVLTQRMDRIYKSTTQLMIERSATSPIEADQLALQRADAGYVGGQVLLLSSDDTLLKVIERADLLDEPAFQGTPPNPLRKAVTWVKSLVAPATAAAYDRPAGAPDQATLKALKILSDAVSVEREGETNVVSIDVRATTPVLAQRIATTLAETYIDMRLEAREAEARRLSDWIDGRADELRAQLTAAEQAVTLYRIDKNLLADSRGASLTEQQLTEINAELIRARADLAQKRASYEHYMRIRAGDGDLQSLPEVQASPIIVALREAQLDLQRREQEASQISRAGNPKLAQIQRQLATVDQQLAEEVLRVAEVLANETEALESRAQILAEALAKAGGQSGVETRSAVELRELERIAEAYRLRYERYLNNAGLANELVSFATSGTEVVSSATQPILPVYPPTKVFVLLSFILGAGLAIVAQLTRDSLSTRFGSIDEIEQALRLRVLSVLPRLDGGKVPRDLATTEPYSPFNEAISVLRQNLRLSAQKFQNDPGAPVVLITSAGESAGKTTIAAALAESASSGGQSVLLVDADLRYAGLSELYDFDDGDGLCDILRGRVWQPGDDAGKSGLDILPAGQLRGRQPADCLATPHLGKLLRHAREIYDLVVIDGPPVANLADCKILAEDCTQIVMVLHFDQTTRDAIRGALRQLPRSKVSGVVVNAVDPKNTSAQWNLGHAYSASYAQSAQLYKLRNAAAEKQKAAEQKKIGKIA